MTPPTPFPPPPATWSLAARRMTTKTAIFAYNRAGWYVADVLAKAEQYRGAMQQATRVRGGAGAQAILAAANKLDAMDIGYIYGGGHVTPAVPNPGLDCSSSVSWVLQHAGINMPTMTSGLLMNWGDPGPGKTITIYANDGHTFMKIGERYFGTTGFGHPGAGTGPHWFTRQPSAGLPGHLRPPPPTRPMTQLHPELVVPQPDPAQPEYPAQQRSRSGLSSAARQGRAKRAAKRGA